MFKTTFKICLPFICFLAQAQYSITFNIKGLKQESYTIGHYFGAKQFIVKDTAANTGSLVFTGNTNLPSGMYLLMNTKKTKLFEFVIKDSQQIVFESDTLNLLQNMKVSGCKQNQIFLEYQQKIKVANEEIAMIQMQERLSGKNDAMANIKISKIRQNAGVSMQTFLAKNKGEWAEKLIQSGSEIQIPDAPKLANGKIDSTWQYRYYKNHFWDNFDFTDESLVRTPFLQRRLDRFMDNVTTQASDSLISSSDVVIQKAVDGKNKEMTAFCIWYITNKYENYDLFGAEGVFVYLAEKYYVGGIMPITDPATVEGIKKKIEILKPLLIGKTFPELNMSDSVRIQKPLKNIKANYTILYFYDPNCGHCKKSAPVLKEFYTKNKDKGIVIYAPAVTGSPESWKQFINDYRMQGWLNTFDFSSGIDFRQTFDVIKTPMIYVLDKDKKIIARKIDAENLSAFFNYYEKRSAK